MGKYGHIPPLSWSLDVYFFNITSSFFTILFIYISKTDISACAKHCQVFQDVQTMRVCVSSRMCIRDSPCRLSNMCCHWEPHWADLLNLALTPETPTPTVLSPALCRTPLKAWRLNNENPSARPLQPARLKWEEEAKSILISYKKELGENPLKTISNNP